MIYILCQLSAVYKLGATGNVGELQDKSIAHIGKTGRDRKQQEPRVQSPTRPCFINLPLLWNVRKDNSQCKDYRQNQAIREAFS